MIDGIRDFFNQFIATDNAASDAARQHALEIATAALLLEMMRMDSTVTDEETATVTRVLQARFGLTAKELDTLLRFATEEARQATDYFQFTSLINRHFPQERKVRMIELMWEVAYADGRLDDHELHLIRRIIESQWTR